MRAMLRGGEADKSSTILRPGCSGLLGALRVARRPERRCRRSRQPLVCLRYLQRPAWACPIVFGFDSAISEVVNYDRKIDGWMREGGRQQIADTLNIRGAA